MEKSKLWILKVHKHVCVLIPKFLPGGEYGGGFWNCWGGTLAVGTPFSAIVQIKVTMTDSDNCGNSKNYFLIKW